MSKEAISLRDSAIFHMALEMGHSRWGRPEGFKERMATLDDRLVSVFLTQCERHGVDPDGEDTIYEDNFEYGSEGQMIGSHMVNQIDMENGY